MGERGARSRSPIDLGSRGRDTSSIFADGDISPLRQNIEFNQKVSRLNQELTRNLHHGGDAEEEQLERTLRGAIDIPPSLIVARPRAERTPSPRRTEPRPEATPSGFFAANDSDLPPPLLMASSHSPRFDWSQAQPFPQIQPLVREEPIVTRTRIPLGQRPNAPKFVRGREASANSNDGGLTPLHWAALRNLLSECSSLLDGNGMGAILDPNGQDSRGRTALHLAAANGFLEVCCVLLDHPRFQASTAVDADGRTALHAAAASCGIQAPEVCGLFMVHPAFVGAIDCRDRWNLTALDLAVQANNTANATVLAGTQPQIDLLVQQHRENSQKSSHSSPKINPVDLWATNLSKNARFPNFKVEALRLRLLEGAWRVSNGNVGVMCAVQDRSNSGDIEANEFLTMCRRFGFPATVLSDADIEDIFNEWVAEDGGASGKVPNARLADWLHTRPGGPTAALSDEVVPSRITSWNPRSKAEASPISGPPRQGVRRPSHADQAATAAEAILRAAKRAGVTADFEVEAKKAADVLLKSRPSVLIRRPPLAASFPSRTGQTRPKSGKSSTNKASPFGSVFSDSDWSDETEKRNDPNEQGAPPVPDKEAAARRFEASVEGGKQIGAPPARTSEAKKAGASSGSASSRKPVPIAPTARGSVSLIAPKELVSSREHVVEPKVHKPIASDEKAEQPQDSKAAHGKVPAKATIVKAPTVGIDESDEDESDEVESVVKPVAALVDAKPNESQIGKGIVAKAPAKKAGGGRAPPPKAPGEKSTDNEKATSLKVLAKTEESEKAESDAGSDAISAKSKPPKTKGAGGAKEAGGAKAPVPPKEQPKAEEADTKVGTHKAALSKPKEQPEAKAPAKVEPQKAAPAKPKEPPEAKAAVKAAPKAPPGKEEDDEEESEEESDEESDEEPEAKAKAPVKAADQAKGRPIEKAKAAAAKATAAEQPKAKAKAKSSSKVKDSDDDDDESSSSGETASESS